MAVMGIISITESRASGLAYVLEYEKAEKAWFCQVFFGMSICMRYGAF